MDQIGILLKLKDLLKDTYGKQAISCLIQLPLFNDYLNDSDNFQKIVDRFKNDSRLWTPLNICRIASGFDPATVLSDDPFPQENKDIESLRVLIRQHPLEKINSINDILILADGINAGGRKLSWREAFDQMDLGSHSFSNSNSNLETLFIVIYEITEEKDKLISSLFGYNVNDAGPKLLARLMMINKSIGDSIIKSLESKTIKPALDPFVQTLKEMHFLGNTRVRFNLAEIFVDVFPFDMKVLHNDGLQKLADDLSVLQYIKNIFLFISKYLVITMKLRLYPTAQRKFYRLWGRSWD